MSLVIMGMHCAGGFPLSFGLQFMQSLLQVGDLLASDLGQLAEVNEEWDLIRVAGVEVAGLMNVTVGGHKQIGLVEGQDSEVMSPKDLLVPVYVDSLGMGFVQERFHNVGCVLGGTIFQSLLWALVRGQPRNLAGAWDDMFVFVLGLAFCPGVSSLLGFASVEAGHGRRRPGGHRRSHQ